MIHWHLLSAISSTPEWEKWVRTLAKLRRAMVNSEMIISEKAEKVEKMPWRSALKAPKPAAAEKLPRSMMPLETNTLYNDMRQQRGRCAGLIGQTYSGCFLWIEARPVEPSRSESMHMTFFSFSSLEYLSRTLQTDSPN